ncbi:MAG: COX15/CtaA family protein, partial [Myxococcales bacterium]
LLGATVRHTGAGLVCVDLPYCRGALWPAGVHPMVHLHMAHRAFALVVLGLSIGSALRLRRSESRLVRALAWAGPLLVGVQIALGVSTILTFKDLVPLTAHLMVGALLMMDQVALLAVTRRAPAAESAPAALGVAA